MKKLIYVFLVFILSAGTARSASPSWAFDGSHSSLVFFIERMLISDVAGSLRMTELKLTTPNEDFTDASVTLVIDATSLDTRLPDRDTHLKSAEIFDAAKYPTMTFKSTSFKKTGENSYAIEGDFTMHGVTKPVTLHAEARSTYDEYSKKNLVGFRVSGVVKRLDYGIASSMPPPMLSDEVKLQANIVMVKN